MVTHGTVTRCQFFQEPDKYTCFFHAFVFIHVPLFLNKTEVKRKPSLIVRLIQYCLYVWCSNLPKDLSMLLTWAEPHDLYAQCLLSKGMSDRWNKQGPPREPVVHTAEALHAQLLANMGLLSSSTDQ